MNSYNTLSELKDMIIKKGFHEYKPTEFDRYAITCFQKRYDDEYGKKYFIDGKVYDFTWTDSIPERYHIGYSCQLYQSTTHNAFNIEFVDWTVEQVEDFVENLFSKGIIEYYEEY